MEKVGLIIGLGKSRRSAILLRECAARTEAFTDFGNTKRCQKP